MDVKSLHNKAVVLDSHCDTPIRLLDGADLNIKSDEGHFDFIKMEEGDVDIAFFVLYTSNKMEPDSATRRALQMLAKTIDQTKKSSGNVTFASDIYEALKFLESGKRVIMVGMENGLPIQEDLSLLRLFAQMGVNYITLTHSGNNAICDSSGSKEKLWNGLSPFGIEVVKEMNRLGILVDVSHISDDAFYDVLKYSKKPVVATHSCCRAICNHPRNLTDQMIKDLAAHGGVIQINFYPPFLNKDYADKFWPLCEVFEEAQLKYKSDIAFYNEFKAAEQKMFALPRPSFKEVVNHIDHVVKLVGTKHVGIGSDFDGIEVTPVGLEGADKMEVITQELVKRGYTNDEIINILGGNFIRVLKQNKE